MDGRIQVDFHMDFCLDLQCAAAISVANGDQGVLDRCPSQVLSGFEDFYVDFWNWIPKWIFF